MTRLPTGTITFLFTDLQGSTALWEQDPQAMRLALVRHDALAVDVALLPASALEGLGDLDDLARVGLRPRRRNSCATTCLLAWNSVILGTSGWRILPVPSTSFRSLYLVL